MYKSWMKAQYTSNLVWFSVNNISTWVVDDRRFAGTRGTDKRDGLARFHIEIEVLVDGHDISKVTLHSLRAQMGIMLQDSFIFSGTIMDNIRYGRLDATDEEIIAAAKTVRAHEFISEMPDGYYTQVNERGSRR